MIMGFNAIKCTYMCLSRNFVRFIKEKFIDIIFPKYWMGEPLPPSIPMPVGAGTIIERDSPWGCVVRLGFVVVRMGLYTNC